MEKLIKFRADEYDRDGLVSVAQVAAKCAVSKATIYNEIKSGLLIAYNLADKTVLKPADVERWARVRSMKITRTTPRSNRGRKGKSNIKGLTDARTQKRKPRISA